MGAYAIGELVGSVIGMMLLGSGAAWVIRRIFRRADFNVSIGVAMLVIALAAGFSNSNAQRPYLATVAMYLVAGIVAYFVVVMLHGRVVPRVMAVMPPSSPRRAVISGTGGLNWSRGFFRVWMLLAVLWFAAIALIGWGSVVSPYVPSKVVATPSATGVATLFADYGEPYQTFSSLAGSGQLVATQVRPGFRLYTPAGMEASALQSRVEEARGLVDAYVQNETVARRSQALPGLIAGALLPPLVLLVLGWSVGWAISGFRRTA